MDWTPGEDNGLHRTDFGVDNGLQGLVFRGGLSLG